MKRFFKHLLEFVDPVRHGTSCLVLACCALYVARMSVLLHNQRLWWYEAVLVAIAMLPSIVAIGIMPLDVWEKESWAHISRQTFSIF